jgi:dolichol-phosphate mannosyltransferase
MVNQNILILRPKFNIFWAIFIRLFLTFNTSGINYVRPERMFGVTTNNLAKNIGWAKKGILSFSYTPLTMLSFMGTVLLLLT